jgi:hypothetical protein
MTASVSPSLVRRRSCHGRARRLSALLAALALLAAPASSQAADLGPTIYDVMVVRPLAAVHTLAGALLFLPMALQAMPGGTAGEAFNTFVLAPANDLYNRPLGEF